VTEKMKLEQNNEEGDEEMFNHSEVSGSNKLIFN